jgi:hypothetical protein
MVGTRTEPRYAGSAVSGARILHFASMVRDPNPAYWDAEFAKRQWGGVVAPPALLMGLLMPPPWVPTGEPPTASIAVRFRCPVQRSSTRPTTPSSVTGIGGRPAQRGRGSGVGVAEKTTRLGVGHFIETLETYSRADGSPVAISRNSLFRYTPAAKS